MTGRQSTWLNLGWLVMLVVTFAVPLTLDAWGLLTYFTSLLMWVLPVLFLWPSFLAITADGQGRRRRALRNTVLSIAGLGTVLDFLFGHLTLRFPGCSGDGPDYLLCLPAIGGAVPIEELLFYALGPAAIVLVYACADEHWLDKYNPPHQLVDVRLIQISPRLIVMGVVALGLALVIWQVRGTFPTYYTFLVTGALLPAIFLYRCVSHLVNWPAFAATSLYVLVTSVIWEVTLAIPRGWWGYEPSGMLGITIDAWSAGPDAPFPVEAAFVWVCVTFSGVLSYEFAKAITHHPAPTTRRALFG